MSSKKEEFHADLNELVKASSQLARTVQSIYASKKDLELAAFDLLEVRKNFLNKWEPKD